MKIESFANGSWHQPAGATQDVFHAVTGEKIGELGSQGIDFKQMLDYARRIGNPALRSMTFHERGRMLKSLAQYLMDRKDEFYPVSAMTGATKVDSWIDIEGGIGTLFVYASKGRRELPDETFFMDGAPEQLSKAGTFIGTHVCVPLEGVALHINAFNFPVWGMLEKLAPTFLAGMPAIVKPASATSYLTYKFVAAMLESGILPEGALQLICGSVGDIFDHLTFQDVVTFTGSAETGRKLKSHPNILENSIRFNMEADSLNCTILGPDVSPDSEDFAIFIKEVVKEMTVKAGQKCTAIRRILVPEAMQNQVSEALKSKLSQIVIGNPQTEGVRMGPLASRAQVQDVLAKVNQLKAHADIIFGDTAAQSVSGADASKGAFCPILLLHAKNPAAASAVHDVEAFGPVSTLMPYKNIEEAIALAKRGQGSLVASLISSDAHVARKVTLELAPYHGRILVLNAECAKESTGHGSPLPHLVHGGPGRAGGGEEMGGIRGLHFYMQRTAIQGSPTMLSKVCREYLPGAATIQDRVHPFRKYFDELEIGETLFTHRRTVTEADIVNFAGVSGDFFYAHTDDIAAKASPFFEARVAHGYFVLSAAAGLFVDPAPGPVLANYGLESLRFVKPVYVGDSIRVRFTCKKKTLKEKRDDEPACGVVEWDVEVLNQENESVALYSILTLVARKEEQEMVQ